MELPESPECPVCLQPFDGDLVTPRVLPCGHSACGACLIQLPQSFPHTVRCPACTQLVKLPYPQGPSGLPKNIDLLRLCSLLTSDFERFNDNEGTQKKLGLSFPRNDFQQFIPNLWPLEFYGKWKDWIVPSDAILVQPGDGDDGYCSVLCGEAVKSSGLVELSTRCLLKENEKLSLVRVGSYSCETDDSKFSYSYEAKIIKVLYDMKDGDRDELSVILMAGLKQSRISKAYGFWYNTNDSGVYLVCEKFRDIAKTKLGDWSTGGSDGMAETRFWGDLSHFALLGMEICEAVSALHSEGLLCGCLALSCFHIDHFCHLYVNFSEVLVVGRRVRNTIAEFVSVRQKLVDKESDNIFKNHELKTFPVVSPELYFALLHNEGVNLSSGSSPAAIGHGSDVWLSACLLLQLLIGEAFNEELYSYFHCLILFAKDDKGCDFFDLYIRWLNKVETLLDTRLDPDFVSLKDVLFLCLKFDMESRPTLTDLWMCIRKLIMKPKSVTMVNLEQAAKDHKSFCLTLGELCLPHKESKVFDGQMVDLEGNNESDKDDANEVKESNPDRSVLEGLSRGHIKHIDLKGHQDCITCLAVGGGFLFSSSYDKTVRVWSLQDLTHLHSFKGHEQKIMGLAFVQELPLCISGDSGGGIFIWAINVPFSEKPLKILQEQKDWRYSGIHALAVSGLGYFYTGSGDKSIKAWLLQDYTLSCTMHGHKSVVSALSVCNGVLYSGSWDGTIRLWCLSDHSPLTVLGEDITGNVSSVLSIAADQHMLVVAHDNGCIKIWSNDVFKKSIQAQKGAIFSVNVEEKWLFTGGLDKTVNVQELLEREIQIEAVSVGSIACDSVITSLLYDQGKLFIGQANTLIKVYQYCL